MKQVPGFIASAPLYLFAISIFIFIVSPNLFSDGMFMDGLIYATVSQNLSEGIGTFWNPQFSPAYLTEFHEHPPLAFGIQSLFYSAFGDHQLIDKVYSVFTILVTGIIMLKIWNFLNLKHGWFLLLSWLMIPLVGWTATNNMLENTMMIFTTLSVYYYLLSTESNKHYFLLVAGISIGLGFLTKGFFAFFPWTFPFLYWVFIRKTSFFKMAIENILLIVYTLLPLALLILLSPEAKLSLQKYFDIQVVNSLQNAVTVDSRFFILQKLFIEILHALGVGIIFWLIYRVKYKKSQSAADFSNYIWLFLCVGLTGVLPIMISLKQNGFYVVTALPLFAIGIALLFYPYVEKTFSKINYRSIGYRIFSVFSVLSFIVSFAVSIYFSGTIGRDKEKLEDIYVILPELDEGEIINIPIQMHEDWSLHGYFSRYKNIGLDAPSVNKRAHLLIQKNMFNESLLNDYEIVDLPLKELMLLRKK